MLKPFEKNLNLAILLLGNLTNELVRNAHVWVTIKLYIRKELEET